MADEWEMLVTVPGSTANLGPGFDSLGLAVNRYLRLRLTPAREWEVILRSDYLQGVDSGEDNLIVRVMRRAFEEAGADLPSFRLEVESELPLARGLGSSAAAIVAGLLAANCLLGNRWSRKELLQKATAWEGHPDNVGASLYGGFVVATWDGERAEVIPLPSPPLTLVAAIPRTPLATAHARNVLPKTLSHREAVLGSSRANLLTAALLTGNWKSLATAMKDRFHQPYRAALVPGMEEVLSRAVDYGAFGAALSGAGPTVIAFCEEPQEISVFMRSVFEANRLPVELWTLRPATEGASVRLTSVGNRSTVKRKTEGVKG
jgi:homoserine kinase